MFSNYQQITAHSLAISDQTINNHSGLLFKELFHTLRKSNYAELQYIPTRKSVFGVFKEWENLNNLFTRSRHLMFYYSFFPEFYLRWVFKRNPGLQFFYDFCFLNRFVDKEKVVVYLGESWVKNALRNSILSEREAKYGLMFSILPVKHYLILRDTHESYKFHEYDSDKPHNRVYVGADSIKFAEFNQKYLGCRQFKHALELGCGTGIQLICLENLVARLTGVDINPRAVEFTGISAQFNNLQARLDAMQSDLFEKIQDRFDLILANPWFLDLEKGGLEEIPDIIDKLDNFLEPGGTFAMYFGSFIKDGVDQGKTIMAKFAQEKGYEATFYRLGKTIEPHFLNRYKELNISFINSYYAIFIKNGSSSVKVIQPGIVRRIRDEIFLPLQRLIAKSRSAS